MKSYRKNFIHQFLLLFSNCFKYRFSYAMRDNGAFNMTPTPYYMCHIQIFDRIDSFLQMFQISLTAKKVDYALIWVILNRAPTHSHPLPSTPTHSQPFQTMPSIIILRIVYYIVHYNAQPTDYQILNIFPTPAIIPTPRLLETGEYTNQNLKSTQSKTVTPKGKEKWTPDCI